VVGRKLVGGTTSGIRYYILLVPVTSLWHCCCENGYFIIDFKSVMNQSDRGFKLRSGTGGSSGSTASRG